MKSFHKLKINYTIGLFVLVNLIFSQTTDSNEILDGYIHAGLKNNSSLKQTFNQWKSAEAKVALAGFYELPQQSREAIKSQMTQNSKCVQQESKNPEQGGGA